MKIRYRQRALADIDDIYLYLHERSPRGALNVLAAIHASINEIADHPFGYVRTDNPDIRVMTVRRYRYRIFYSVIENDAVEIIHVRHTSRRPWLVPE
jgi:plasmid stabilization system protein ParE